MCQSEIFVIEIRNSRNCMPLAEALDKADTAEANIKHFDGKLNLQAGSTAALIVNIAERREVIVKRRHYAKEIGLAA